MPQTRESTAYHEAGHTVAHVRFGFATERVTIRPDREKGSLGHATPLDAPYDQESLDPDSSHSVPDTPLTSGLRLMESLRQGPGRLVTSLELTNCSTATPSPKP